MLALLSALYSDKLRGKQENFFNQVIASESFDHLSSQIYYLLATLHLSDQVPPFFREALSQQTSKNLVRNLILKAQLRKLLQSFESLGIDTIVHDGPYLTEKYYRDLAARYREDVLFLWDQNKEIGRLLLFKPMALSQKKIPYFHAPLTSMARILRAIKLNYTSRFSILGGLISRHRTLILFGRTQNLFLPLLTFAS